MKNKEISKNKEELLNATMSSPGKMSYFKRRWHENKLAKNTLAKRMRKSMTLSAVISLVILTALTIILMFSIISFITNTYVQYSANQMAYVLSDKWEYNDESDVTAIEDLIDALAHTSAFDETGILLDAPDEKNVQFIKDASKQIKDFQGFSHDQGNFLSYLATNLIHYKVIYINGDIEETVYNTENIDRYRIKNKFLRDLFDKYIAEAKANIYDFKEIDDDVMKSFVREEDMGDIIIDKPVAHIEAIINPNLTLVLVGVMIAFVVIVFLTNAVVNVVLRNILSGIVTKPVVAIANQLDKLSKDDIEDSLGQKIQVKKPPYEVAIMMKATNEIIQKTSDHLHIMEEQNSELEAQKEEQIAQNITLQDRSTALASMNDAYLGRTLNLQNLLDNVGQGFFTIDKDLKINPEFSLECRKIFGKTNNNLKTMVGSFEGFKITDVLFAYEDKEFIEDILNKVFQSPYTQKEIYLSLLPEELVVKENVFHIEYKLVSGVKGQAQILIIVTDITSSRLLESQMEEKKNHLQMIVKVLMSRSEFIELIEDYRDFAKKDFSEFTKEDYEDIIREIHTFKGSFSQYYVDEIVNYLNGLEDLLISHNEQLITLTKDVLLEPLDKDIEIIKEYVGEEFFGLEDHYNVKEKKISEIEFRLKELLPEDEYKRVLPLIQSIRHKNVKDLLKTCTGYTYKLAERLDKSIHEFEITGDDIYIDKDIYHNVFKSFVHLFRNAVDHGIEDEEERSLHHKEAKATITCDVQKKEDYFSVTISDDGRGIDLDTLVKCGVEKGFIDTYDLSDINKMNLLFKDGLTSKKNPDTISGKGIGLATVNYEVKKLGGTIDVLTSHNAGSTFIINLPFIN